MGIRELILRVLEGRQGDISDIQQPVEQHSPSEGLDEISTADLLNYTIPYIKGVMSDGAGIKEKALEFFDEYCEDCEYLNIVNKEVIRLCKDIYMLSRDAKIVLATKLSRFRFDYIDWDDREWIVDLLEYFYIKAAKNIEYLKREMVLVEGAGKDKEKNDGIECIRIDENGRRSSMLVNRIKPTMTLEEFADKLVSGIEEKKVSSFDEESSSEKYSREELLKKDEKNDSKSADRGNTVGMG